MKPPPKTSELVTLINSVLEKSRDTFSDNEVQGLQETIFLLEKLEAEPHDATSNIESVAKNLLLFFMKHEFIGQIVEWFEHINN
jgi:hypothetical protein